MHPPGWRQTAEGGGGGQADGPEPKTLEEAVAALEKRMIRDSLIETGGNMTRSARMLGITERIMGLRMKKYGLEYREFRSAAHDAE